jgi:hypothetical protein
MNYKIITYDDGTAALHIDGKKSLYFATTQDAILWRHTMVRHEEYVNEVKSATKDIWDGINKLQALQSEWNALDYTNTLQDVLGIQSTDVGAVVFATTNAMRDLLATGHATNIARLIR